MTSSEIIAPTKVRAAYLDLIKTILAVGMIFAHSIQLVEGTPRPLEYFVSFYINLVTFSGLYVRVRNWYWSFGAPHRDGNVALQNSNRTILGLLRLILHFCRVRRWGLDWK